MSRESIAILLMFMLLFAVVGFMIMGIVIHKEEEKQDES